MPFRDENGMFCDRQTAVYYTDGGMRYPVDQGEGPYGRGYVYFDRGVPIDSIATGTVRCHSCGWRATDVTTGWHQDPVTGNHYCTGCWHQCQHDAVMDGLGYVSENGPCQSQGTGYDAHGTRVLCTFHLQQQPRCEYCAQMVVRSNVHFCPTCRVYRCSEMRSSRTRSGRTVFRCLVCARNGAQLMSYGAVPGVVVFRSHRGIRRLSTDGDRHSYPHAPDDSLYLGLELETELPRESDDDDDDDDDDYYGSGNVENIVTAWHATGLGWSTSDGSLYCGAECKTHPSTYQWLRRDDRLRLACQSLIRAGPRAWEYESTGLHTHVSMAAFPRPSLLYRFAWLQVSAMREQCVRLSGRRDAHYAMWPDNHGNYQSPLPILAGKESKRDRSVALNVNADTLELRYWKGTVTGSSVIGQCAFIDALFQYAPTFADSDAVAGNVNWETFGTWATRALPASQVRDIAQLCANRHQPFPLELAPEREV